MLDCRGHRCRRLHRRRAHAFPVRASRPRARRRHVRRGRGQARRRPVSRRSRASASRSPSPTPQPIAAAAPTSPSSRSRTPRPRRSRPRCSRPGVTVVDLSADFRLQDRRRLRALVRRRRTRAPGAARRGGLRAAGARRARRSAGRRGSSRAPAATRRPRCSRRSPRIEAGLVRAGLAVIVGRQVGRLRARAGRPRRRTHFCSADEAVAPYKVASHRHIPEIAQQLAACGRAPSRRSTFAPHLVPMDRGLLSTVYLERRRRRRPPSELARGATRRATPTSRS